jgi:hypothetical protein|tara:strand:- start:568 stop:798 length:231 start_codon:yes stop_codon:yes gene_type:complete
MNAEQQQLTALPLTAGTSFADSLYTSQLMLNYVTAIEELEENTATAIASGDITTAVELAMLRTGLDEEMFSLSFDA